MAFTLISAGGSVFAIESDVNPVQGPSFVSTPVETGNSGEFYTYTAQATDPNDQELTYSLVSPPDGMTINQWTGRIMWVPDDDDIGANSITVRVTDEDDITADQTYTLTIGAFTGTDIDAAWLAARSAPYMLTSANETYRLLVDVTVTGTAFVCGAANVVLNLNGHTVTYDNGTPCDVTNGGFETDAIGATTVTGWDLTNAPSAAVAANDRYLWGDKVLKFSSLNGTQYIESDPISIPTSDIRYAASYIAVSGKSVTSVGTISIIDDDTDEVLGTSTSSGNLLKGQTYVAYCTPDSDVSAVRVRVAFACSVTDDIRLDYVEFTRCQNYGVIAAGTWTLLPVYMRTIPNIIANCSANRNSTIVNGTITQGQSDGYYSQAIVANSAKGLTVWDVDINVSGTDADAVWAVYGTGTLDVSNCTITTTSDKITDRMGSFWGYVINTTSATSALINVFDNVISGVPQRGMASGGQTGHFAGNTVTMATYATNGYAFDCNGVASVHDNTVTVPEGGSGRALFIGTSTDVHVYNNTFSVRERRSYEYPAGGLEATAVRVRAYVPNHTDKILFENNTLTAYTDDTLASECIAMRATQSGDPVDWVFRNNTFKAIVNTTNTDYKAYTISLDHLGDGILPSFIGNTFESNHVCLRLGGNDGGYNIDTVIGTFTSNTITKSEDGASRTFESIRAGDNGTGDVSDAILCDFTFTGGATDEYVYTGTGTKELSRAWLLTVEVEDAGGNPISGATVTVLDKDSVEVGSGTTDASGLVSDLQIVEEIETVVGTGEPSVNNRNDHTIQVTKTGYSPYSDTETVDATKTHTAVMTAV